VADELNPRQMWEIVNKLETLDKKLDRADARIEGVVQVLDGVGQQPGIRQQLRELRHYVEGNPPAVRGIIKELEALNASYLKIHADLNERYETLQRELTDRHDKLRSDFDAYVKAQATATAKRDGAWGGAKLLWGLLGGAFLGLITVISLLVAIYNSTSAGGG
jgi:chromosome segregation ATPase